MVEVNAYYENIYYKIWAEGRLVVFEYKNNALMGLEYAKEMVSIRRKMFSEQDLCLVYLTSMIGCYTYEAGHYLATKEGCGGLKKGALIVNTSINKILANSYIYFCKPVVPGRAFLTKKDAVEWLLL